MAKKDKNKALENIETATANIQSEVSEQNNVFDFSDKDKVTLVGTGLKGFIMSPKKEYHVIGKVAKILIKKGAAKLK
jgi:hypothetical protein